ncbi:unnamed protein product [Linum trigynum]|uniref:Uncharacterized protein n=1 Tax=Linum trigynum TaxID=586398 RepID=A0AAV2DCY4_9ROSI
MEFSDTAPSGAASCTSAANWTVAGGSLKNSVTFESPLSFIDDQDCDSGDNCGQEPVDYSNSKSESPLILYPPSPDSFSCEITLTFPQKQEVRQVYVRSTARVFEIYCAPESESSAEYLCTVRCCVAVRDEEVLRATNIEEAVLVHQMGSSNDLAKGKFRNGASPTGSEDDWVDVKALRNSLPSKENGSMSSNSDTDAGCSSQDLYEATAEISDTDPCKSLTIRLLSLQNKGCVCIDQVYVFAFPIDAATQETQPISAESSSGSSLMAMLIPTFFQLSRTHGVGREQEKLNIDRSEQQVSVETCLTITDAMGTRNVSEELGPYDTQSREEHKSGEVSPVIPDSVSTEDKVQHEEKDLPSFQEGIKLPDAVHSQIPASSFETEYRARSSQNCTGSVLDHLVSRVNRIEDLILRFEGSILEPINSIDKRLQRVEQQLEVIAKKSHNPGTRISAPEFACGEAEANSLYNSGSLDLSCMACEDTKKDPASAASSIPPEEDVNLVQPSLVVSTPKFDIAEEEQNLAIEPVPEPLKSEQKHSVSIDDALASAFAGFLSSTLSQCQDKYSQTLATRAPDFLNEDEDENDDDTTSSPKIQSETPMDPLNNDEIPGLLKLHPEMTTGLSAPVNETCGADGFTASFLSMPCNKNVIGSLDAEGFPYMERTPIGQWQDGEGCEGDTQLVELQQEEAEDPTSNAAIVQPTEMLEEASKEQTNHSDPSQVAALRKVSGFTPDNEQDSNQDALEIIHFSRTSSSVVDYGKPILEVKFASGEGLNGGSPLQSLLSGFGDVDIEVPSTRETDEDLSGLVDNHGDLIPAEDWEAAGSTMESCISLDMNYYSLEDEHTNIEAAENQDDCEPCYNQDGSATSLI